MSKTIPSTWEGIVPADVFPGLPVADAQPGSILQALRQQNRIWAHHVRPLCRLVDNSGLNLALALTTGYQVIGEGVVPMIDVSNQRRVRIHVYGVNVTVRVTFGGVTLSTVSVGGTFPNPIWASSGALSITGATVPGDDLVDVQIEAKRDASSRMLVFVCVEELAESATYLPDLASDATYIGLDDQAVDDNGPYDAWLTSQLTAGVVTLRRERSRGWAELLPLLDGSFTGSRHYLGHALWRGDGPYLFPAEPWTTQARVAVVVDASVFNSGDVYLFAMSDSEDFSKLLADGSRVETLTAASGKTTYSWTVNVQPGRINSIWIMARGAVADSGNTIKIDNTRGGHIFYTVDGSIWPQASQAVGGNYPLTWSFAVWDRRTFEGAQGNDVGSIGNADVPAGGRLRDVAVVVGRDVNSVGDDYDRFYMSPSLVLDEDGPGPSVAQGGPGGIGLPYSIYEVGVAQLLAISIDARPPTAGRPIQYAENLPSVGVMTQGVIEPVNEMMRLGTPVYSGRVSDQQDFWAQSSVVGGSSITAYLRSYGDWLRIPYDASETERDILIPIDVDPNQGASSGLLSRELQVFLWLAYSRAQISTSEGSVGRARIRTYDNAAASVEKTYTTNLPVWTTLQGPGAQARSAVEVAVYGQSHNIQSGTTATLEHRTTEGASTCCKAWPADLPNLGQVWRQAGPFVIDLSGASFPMVARIGVTNQGFFDEALGYPGTSATNEQGILHVAAAVCMAGARE